MHETQILRHLVVTCNGSDSEQNTLLFKRDLLISVFLFNQNYNKILERDWLTPVGQCTPHAYNWIV